MVQVSRHRRRVRLTTLVLPKSLLRDLPVLQMLLITLLLQLSILIALEVEASVLVRLVPAITGCSDVPNY